MSKVDELVDKMENTLTKGLYLTSKLNKNDEMAREIVAQAFDRYNAARQELIDYVSTLSQPNKT